MWFVIRRRRRSYEMFTHWSTTTSTNHITNGPLKHAHTSQEAIYLSYDQAIENISLNIKLLGLER